MSRSPEPRSLRSVGAAKLISVSWAELINIDLYLVLGSEFDLRTLQQLVAPHSLSIGYIPCKIGSNSNTDQKSGLDRPTSSTAFCCFELVNVEYNKFKFCTTGVEHSSNKRVPLAASSRLSESLERPMVLVVVEIGEQQWA